jgi:hypothetical protein
MAEQNAVRRQRDDARPEPAANKSAWIALPAGGEASALVKPANDNPADHDLPSCLAVTDEEVRLLHRYLSRAILGLFS